MIRTKASSSYSYSALKLRSVVRTELAGFQMEVVEMQSWQLLLIVVPVQLEVPLLTE